MGTSRVRTPEELEQLRKDVEEWAASPQAELDMAAAEARARANTIRFRRTHQVPDELMRRRVTI